MITMNDRIIRRGNLETTYSPEDFVNPDSFDSNDTKQWAFVFLNGGFVIGIVFDEYSAYTEQDALDEMADSGKLDFLRVNEDDCPEDCQEDHVAFLGNAGEPFDIDTLEMWIVNAHIAFGEDISLMTVERVMLRLELYRDKVEHEYEQVSVYSDEWPEAYNKTQTARDAITLYRLIKG